MPSLEEVMKRELAFQMTIAGLSENMLMQEVTRLLFTLTTSKRTEVTRNLLETNRGYLIDSHTEIYRTIVEGDAESYRDKLESVVRPDYYGD